MYIDLRMFVLTYILAQDHIKSHILSGVSLISCSKKQIFMVDIVDISLAYEQIKIDIRNCVFYYHSFGVFQKNCEDLAMKIIHLGMLEWIIGTEAFRHLILFQWLISPFS